MVPRVAVAAHHELASVAVAGGPVGRLDAGCAADERAVVLAQQLGHSAAARLAHVDVHEVLACEFVLDLRARLKRY
jgi:hypothetical protein